MWTTKETSCLIFSTLFSHKRSEVNAEKYKKLLLRPLIQSDDIMSRIQPIREAVMAKGDIALLEFTEKFDRVKLPVPVVTLPLKEKLNIDPSKPPPPPLPFLLPFLLLLLLL